MLIYLQMIESEKDKSKFEQLYLLYRGMMFHIARNLLRNEQDAEDAVHQAFLSILTHLHQVKTVRSPETRAWVAVIVERKALDLLRAQSRRSAEEFDEAAVGLTVPLPGDNGLADAMALLPARYREALLLRYDFGCSTRELARFYGIKPDSAARLLHRAREVLRDRLKEAGYDG